MRILGIVVLTASVLAQTPQGGTRSQQMSGLFQKGDGANGKKQYCEAAAAYEEAQKAAEDLKDNDARFTAALDIADAIANGSCPGEDPRAAYTAAIGFATPCSHKEMAANNYALFLFHMNDREGAITELTGVESEFIKDAGATGIERRDLAVYQYNLGRIYYSTPSDPAEALKEFKKALWNRPGYPEAADAAFGILRSRVTNVEAALQGAEIVELMQISGYTEPALHQAVALLEKTSDDPQAEVLLGALLKCFLALPIDPQRFAGDWTGLLKSADAASVANPQFAKAIQQLHKAYGELVDLPTDPTQVSHAYSAWVAGPSSVEPLAALLVRRGVDEHEHDPQVALAFYTSAWFLSPADTNIGLLLSGLLSAHTDLDLDHHIAHSLLDAYVPPASKVERLISWLKPPSASEQFQHTRDDWLNIENIYKLLAPLVDTIPKENVIAEINRRADYAGELANRPKANRVAQAFNGERLIEGRMPKEIEGDAVYIEILTEGAHGEEIRETAIADISPVTRQYSARLLRSVSGGDSIRVYPVCNGEKADTPINQNKPNDPRFTDVEKVQSESFVNLRHVHTYIDGGVDATAGRPLANIAGSFAVTAEGSFRLHNHGQPYLPNKSGYLISSFASFALAPFSLSKPTDALMQIDNGRSFEAGMYTPVYSNLTSGYFRGDLYSAFVAPIVKTGFHAAGSDQDRVLYKYGAAGLRTGAFRFARYGEKVPELKGFFDITAGKWQNLETFPEGVRNLPLRAEFKGQFSIVGTSAYIGFLRTAGPGPNDFRIFAGFRFDLSQPLSRVVKVD